MTHAVCLKRMLAVTVGLLMVTRPFFGAGFLVYPYVALIRAPFQGNGDSPFTFMMAVLDGAYLTIGLFLIANGFEGLRRYRRRSGIVAATFGVGALCVLGYLFLPR